MAKNDIMPQTGQTGVRTPPSLDTGNGVRMTRLDWLITLIVRTIGAQRGRAARGRPGRV